MNAIATEGLNQFVGTRTGWMSMRTIPMAS